MGFLRTVARLPRRVNNVAQRHEARDRQTRIALASRASQRTGLRQLRFVIAAPTVSYVQTRGVQTRGVQTRGVQTRDVEARGEARDLRVSQAYLPSRYAFTAFTIPSARRCS